MSRRAVTLLAGAALVSALVACVTNPATGRKQLIFVSQEQEIRLGQEAHPGIQAEYGAYDDPRLATLLQEVGGRLAASSERPTLPYTFTLLDSPIVNAFALPGGPVYATRGLLAYAQDEAELAGVLGHEIGHVVGRHGAEQASRGQLLQGVLGIATIARPGVRRYADLLGAGAGLMLMSFGRDAEREADGLGVRYLGRAGYDPFGLPRYLGVLDALADARGQVLPSWLSTHPDPGSRVATTRGLATPVLERMRAAGTVPRSAADEFLPRLSGLVYGDDPREGFQKGATFHHPALRFRYDLPEGWTSRNTKQFVASVDDEESPTAQLVLRLVPRETAGELSPQEHAAQVARKNPQVTLQGTSQVVNGLSAWLGQVSIQDSGGATQRAHIAWIRHGGLMYELTGAWSQEAAPGTVSALERSIRSFREERDASVLSVEPAVLRVELAPRGQSLESICRARASDLAAPCEELAQVNRVEAGAVLETGRRLKLPLRQHPMYP